MQNQARITMKVQRRAHDRRRWREKMQMNMKWKAVCSPYQMPEGFVYYLLNRTTTVDTLMDLIEVARQTTTFTLDTENDSRKKKPALIQVECLDDRRPIVIIVETCHLPPASTSLFALFVSLFRIILCSEKIIQTWGPLEKELVEFISCGLFQADDLNLSGKSKKNIQNDFKRWYNRMHPHSDRCIGNDGYLDDDDEDDEIITNDFRSCRCLLRPYKSPSHLWSLQLAIAYTTGQHLDKSHSISRWGLGLDRRLQNNMLLNQTYQPSTQLFVPQKYFSERQRCSKLIYAMNDCFAVTKLAKIIGQTSHPERLRPYEQSRLIHQFHGKETQRKHSQSAYSVPSQRNLSNRHQASATIDLVSVHARLEAIDIQLRSIEFDDDEASIDQLLDERRQLQHQQQLYLQQQYQQRRHEQLMKDPSRYV